MDESSPPLRSHFSPQEIAGCCAGRLHPAAVAGLRLFNARKYFEAHEALEAAWRDEAGPARNLYRGILQVGVAYYHILQGNDTGARKVFRRCWRWLDPFPETCRGIDVGKLRRDARQVEEQLIRLGTKGVRRIPDYLFRPVVFTLPEED